LREHDMPSRRTKKQYLADQAALFDASPYKDDKGRRDRFLKQDRKPNR